MTDYRIKADQLEASLAQTYEEWIADESEDPIEAAVHTEQMLAVARGAIDTLREAGKELHEHNILSRERATRQVRVLSWAKACFGEAEATSLPQRGLRLLEEAIECFQAAGGDDEQAHKLVDYIFDRPVGELHQEIGGVGVTLLALAAAAGTSADALTKDEVDRILSLSPEYFAERNARKNAAGFKAK